MMTKRTRGARVLVVDDESAAREGLKKLLEQDGYRVETAESGRHALDVADDLSPDVVITDLKMPEMDGIELLSALSDRDPDLPIIVVTAFGDISSAVDAMRAGAANFLTKPVDFDALTMTLERALERHRERIEVDGLGQEVGGARPHGVHGRGNVAEGGDHDDGEVGVSVAEGAQELDPVHLGHLEIRDDDVGRQVVGYVQRVSTALRRLDAVAVLLEELLEPLSRRALVVDHQHARSAGSLRHHLESSSLTRLGASSGSKSGSTIRNRVAPGRLSTDTSPPWSLTMRWTIDSPSPVPRSLVE